MCVCAGVGSSVEDRLRDKDCGAPVAGPVSGDQQGQRKGQSSITLSLSHTHTHTHTHNLHIYLYRDSVSLEPLPSQPLSSSLTSSHCPALPLPLSSPQMLARMQPVVDPAMTTSASDGFFLNLSWLMLKLAAPFAKRDAPLIRSIDPLYCLVKGPDSAGTRLDLSSETRMAPLDPRQCSGDCLPLCPWCICTSVKDAQLVYMLV